MWGEGTRNEGGGVRGELGQSGDMAPGQLGEEAHGSKIP